jgi:steroid delta-isomerase-like uncharacterized protein
MSTPDDEAVVRRFYDEIMSQGRLAVADEILTPNFVMRMAGYELQGIADFKKFVTSERTAMPDYHFTLERVIANGGKVAVRWSQLGTHEGAELYGVPPTGKQISDQGINIFHVANGRIEGTWVSEDTLGVMRQLSAVPPLAPAPAPPPQAAQLPVPATQPQIPAAATTTPSENQALVHRYFDAVISGRDLASASELMDPSCASMLPNLIFTLPLPMRGPQSWTRVMTALLEAMPDLTTTIDDEVASGDTVVVRWTSRGTNTGSVGLIPPSNASVTLEGITWFRIAGGKLVENLVNEDQFGLLQQIGAIREGGNLTPAENKALVHRFFDGIWNQSNYDLIDQYIAPDFVQHVPGQESGREGFRNTVTQAHSAFEEMQVVIDDEIATRDKVVHRWRWNCTHTGVFAGIPPTGKKVSFTGMTIVRLAGEQIVEHWASMDTRGLLQQLGAIPALEAQRA